MMPPGLTLGRGAAREAGASSAPATARRGGTRRAGPAVLVVSIVLRLFLVLLKARGVKLEEVEAALDKRTTMSGLEEKASRKGGS